MYNNNRIVITNDVPEVFPWPTCSINSNRSTLQYTNTLTCLLIARIQWACKITHDNIPFYLHHNHFCYKFNYQIINHTPAQSNLTLLYRINSISSLFTHNMIKFSPVNIKSLHHWPTNMIQYNLINIKSLHHFIIQYHKSNIIKIDPLCTPEVESRLFKSTRIGHMLLNQCSSGSLSAAFTSNVVSVTLESSHRVAVPLSSPSQTAQRCD